MGLININSLGAFLNVEGLTQVSDVLLAISVPINNIRLHLPDMINANKKIIEGLSFLNNDVKEWIFMKDIRIRGSFDDRQGEPYYVTQFHAIDLITTASQAITSGSNPYTSQMANLFYFINTNSLDDFIYKNSAMKDLFLELVNNEKDFFEWVIFLCLVITPILLVCVAMVFIFIMGIHYIKEREYLLAFIKLNPKKIESVKNSLKNFEKGLVNEEEFGYKTSMNIFKSLITVPKYEQESHSKMKHKAQKINYKTIKSKYRIYMLKMTIYVTVLIALLIANYLTAESIKEKIYRKQYQLQFANEISNIATVSYETSSYMILSNNTLNVSRENALITQRKQAVEIKNILEQIPTVFQEEDQSIDSEIQNILFYDTSCKGLTESALYYCGLLSNTFKQRTTLVSCLGLLETSVNTKIRKFVNFEDKSNMTALISLANSDLELYLPSFIIVAAQSQLIANILDKALSKYISEAYDQRLLFLIFFSVCMLLVSFMIWSHILSKLREIDNDFKELLQVFPSTLILSSFLLKMFLKKTSREIINL